MEPIVNPSDVVVRPILTSKAFAEVMAEVKAESSNSDETLHTLRDKFEASELVAFASYDVRGGGDGIARALLVLAPGETVVLHALQIDVDPDRDLGIDLVAQPLLQAAINFAKQSGARRLQRVDAGEVEPYIAGLMRWAGLITTYVERELVFEDAYPEDTKDERRFSLLSDLDDNAAIKVSHDDFLYMASQRPGNLVLPLCHDEHSFFRDNVDRPLTQFVLHDNHHNHQAAYAAVQAEYDDNEFAVGARIQWLFTRPDLSPESVSALMGYIQHALGGSECLRFWAPKQSIKDVVHQLNGAPINIEGH